MFSFFSRAFPFMSFQSILLIVLNTLNSSEYVVVVIRVCCIDEDIYSYYSSLSHVVVIQNAANGRKNANANVEMLILAISSHCKLFFFLKFTDRRVSTKASFFCPSLDERFKNE